MAYVWKALRLVMGLTVVLGIYVIIPIVAPYVFFLAILRAGYVLAIPLLIVTIGIHLAWGYSLVKKHFA